MDQIMRTIFHIEKSLAIEWGRQAWDEVSTHTLKKCFEKTGLYPQEEVLEDDPTDNKELQDLQGLIDSIGKPCTAEEYIMTENEIEVCSGFIDTCNPMWRKTVREELLINDVPDLSTYPEGAHSSSDDEYDNDIGLPTITLLTEATMHGEKLWHFAQFHGYQELALTISKANDLITELKLNGLRCQTHIEDYFMSAKTD